MSIESLDSKIVALAESNGITDKKIIDTLDVVNNKVDSIVLRNIGEIVYSTIPLVDAALHPANGLILLHDGVYSAFVAYMKSLYEDTNNTYADLFCTEEQFQASITANGVCGKYVYDTTTGDLRIPKIDMVSGTTQLSELGSLSNKGYLASNGINAQAITKAYAYIVLANTTKTKISVDIDNATTELNNLRQTKEFGRTINITNQNTIDLSTGGVVFLSTPPPTVTYQFIGVPTNLAATFTLIITNGGSKTINWPSSVKWADGNVPILSETGVDVLTFLTGDGGVTWYGIYSINNAS